MFKPTYVVGDFNTEDFVELVAEFRKNYIKTIDKVTTVDGKKFDEILVPKKTKFTTECIKLLSDHFLVITTI